MNSVIYLDNSATTKPCETAVEFINKALTENWGNPSSLHEMGISAENILNTARLKISKLICAAPEEIFFTGSGTEANNIALLGSAEKLKKRGNRIVTTTIEHPSVKEAIDYLENSGFEVIRLAPQKNGVISPADIYSAVNEKTVLVSIMLVNNELGSVQPINAAADAIKASGAPAFLHCDAVQAFGKMPINVKKLNVDFLSASGHKIHGPKGVGFLYKRKGISIPSPVFGGGQENGLRSGTQPMPAIAGLLGALNEMPEVGTELIKQTELWEYAVKALENTSLVTVNSKSGCLPYILNITVNGYKSETLLHFLESEKIYVSSGSACAKGKSSYVLKSIGLSKNEIDSSLRLSFSRFNTKDEIDTFCAVLKRACNFLRKAY